MGRYSLCYLMNGLNLMKGRRLEPRSDNSLAAVVTATFSLRELEATIHVKTIQFQVFCVASEK